MTKSDKVVYQKMLLSMMEPLKSHFSESCATLDLAGGSVHYGSRIAGMEGFARLLWGMAPYWAGGGTDESMLPYFQKGLISGTDPKSPEYWGDLPYSDQRTVEMAAIGNSLLLAPDKLWDPLPPKAQDNLAAWLLQINLYKTNENNWQFFAVLVNLALKKLGREYSQPRIEEAVAMFESFYLGDGWYSDGKRKQIDYYISFAIHYYCLIYAYHMKDEEPERAALYCERAKTFAQTFIYWFAEDGSSIAFGRSQTYRFAQVAFFSACIVTGVDCFSPGVMKGLVQRHLRHWMNQKIFDNAGVLTVGYGYPNLIMSEEYNAPGSPFWALKAFAFLAIPDQHEFWNIAEEPLPALSSIKAIPQSQMLMHHRRTETIAYTAGQYPGFHMCHSAEKYAKFAYSSRFGFSVPRSYFDLNEAAPDSMLCFYVHGMYYVRRTCEEFRISVDEVYARWCPVEGIEVETWIQPTESGHKRKHRIKSSMACTAFDSGFAYPFNHQDTVLHHGEHDASVTDNNGRSAVRSQQGKGKIIHCDPNTNLIFPLTRLPAIEYDIPVGTIEVVTEIATE